MDYTIVTNAVGAISIIGIVIYTIFAFRRAGGIAGITKSFIDSVNNVESAWVNLLAFFIPYAVSLIPATMTFRNSQTVLGFEIWEAVNAAAAIEFFGIVTMDTALRFYQYNKKYTSEANKAPVGAAVFSYIFYLVIIIIVNVMMEIATAPADSLHWFQGAMFWRIVALTFLSTLGFPSAVIIGIRTQHKEIINQRTAAKQQGQPQGKPQKQDHHESKPKPASAYKDRMLDMLNNEYAKTARVLSPKEITAALKLDHNNSKGFVSTTTSAWMADKGISKESKKGGNGFTI